MGFRAIGRVLGVSNVTVLNWVRAYGQLAELVLEQQPGKEVKTAELDELHTYIGRKKTTAGSWLPSIGKENNS